MKKKLLLFLSLFILVFSALASKHNHHDEHGKDDKDTEGDH